MDNEKFQDLMLDQFAKLFKEVQEVKGGLTEVKNSQFRMESRLSGVESRLVRMENDFGKKLDVLYYDWRETQKQFNDEVKNELQILSTKVEAQQMQSTKHDQEIKDLYLVKASKE